MKWLSIKKFTPPSCTNLFIRAVKSDSQYDRHFVGMIEEFLQIKDLRSWEMANGQELIDINPIDYKVTHFAIIDSVEIEE